MFKKQSLICLTAVLLAGCTHMTGLNLDLLNELTGQETTIYVDHPADIPEITEIPTSVDYITLNDNVPKFTDEELKQTEPFEKYGELDELGRVNYGFALLDQVLMPETDRESISSITPTGWQQAKYNDNWLYNRSHLIGYQLTGQNANPRNLMTGTRQFNVDGMLPFENYVADYIEQTNNRVLYKVTPVFTGDNLLADGVIMEALSLDDDKIMMNVFVPNHQTGVELDYQTGKSTEL